MSKQKRTYAIDFDGVLHQYDGWSHGKLGPPITGAREAVQQLLDAGGEVVVFTTRDKAFVAAWLVRYDFPQLEVTGEKRPFWVIIDDRCIRFDGNWDGVVQRAMAFEPYWVKRRTLPEEGQPQAAGPTGAWPG